MFWAKVTKLAKKRTCSGHQSTSRGMGGELQVPSQVDSEVDQVQLELELEVELECARAVLSRKAAAAPNTI